MFFFLSCELTVIYQTKHITCKRHLSPTRHRIRPCIFLFCLYITSLLLVFRQKKLSLLTAVVLSLRGMICETHLHNFRSALFKKKERKKNLNGPFHIIFSLNLSKRQQEILWTWLWNRCEAATDLFRNTTLITNKLGQCAKCIWNHLYNRVTLKELNLITYPIMIRSPVMKLFTLCSCPNQFESCRWHQIQNKHVFTKSRWGKTLNKLSPWSFNWWFKLKVLKRISKLSHYVRLNTLRNWGCFLLRCFSSAPWKHFVNEFDAAVKKLFLLPSVQWSCIIRSLLKGLGTSDWAALDLCFCLPSESVSASVRIRRHC